MVGFHLRRRNLRIDKPIDFVMDHQSGGFKTPVKTSQDMAEAMRLEQPLGSAMWATWGWIPTTLGTPSKTIARNNELINACMALKMRMAIRHRRLPVWVATSSSPPRCNGHNGRQHAHLRGTSPRWSSIAQQRQQSIRGTMCQRIRLDVVAFLHKRKLLSINKWPQALKLVLSPSTSTTAFAVNLAVHALETLNTHWFRASVVMVFGLPTHTPSTRSPQSRIQSRCGRTRREKKCWTRSRWLIWPTSTWDLENGHYFKKTSHWEHQQCSWNFQWGSSQEGRVRNIGSRTQRPWASTRSSSRTRWLWRASRWPFVLSTNHHLIQRFLPLRPIFDYMSQDMWRSGASVQLRTCGWWVLRKSMRLSTRMIGWSEKSDAVAAPSSRPRAIPAQPSLPPRRDDAALLPREFEKPGDPKEQAAGPGYEEAEEFDHQDRGDLAPIKTQLQHEEGTWTTTKAVGGRWQKLERYNYWWACTSGSGTRQWWIFQNLLRRAGMPVDVVKPCFWSCQELRDLQEVCAPSETDHNCELEDPHTLARPSR